jgi:hypothetical protein
MNTTQPFRLMTILLILSIFLVPAGPVQAGNAPTGEGLLIWNTFLGSSVVDFGAQIAVDPDGNIYVTGYSYGSWGNPIHPRTGSSDVFVAKLDNNGTLIWNTFLGGSDSDESSGIALDGNGNIYVLGKSCASWGSPKSPFQGGYSDAFVARLNNNGVLAWNTFLGGKADDQASGIAAGAGGNVYVTGESFSGWGQPLRSFKGSKDAFVAKLNAQGTRLWNTFLGGTGQDTGIDITLDGSGNLFVIGLSRASWGTPRNPYSGGIGDALIAKLADNGTFLWHTFLGGSGQDFSSAVDVAENGNLYIVGSSDDTWGDPLSPFTGEFDAYVAALDGEGTLVWNTFLGWLGLDYGNAIQVRGSGNILVAGDSEGTWGMPIRAYTGFGDTFAAGLDGSGALIWNTFLGGKNVDEAGDLVLDPHGNAYISSYSGAGWGSPVLAGLGSYDVYVAKLGTAGKFFSDGALDGRVLESSEISDKGGTLNAAAAAFILGDDASDRQYRAVLSFNTSGLPDTAVITKATLKIKRFALVGTDPFTTHMGLKVDIRKPYFGTTSGLALNDFQAPAGLLAAATFNKTPAAGGWHSAVLSAAAYPYINLTGLTQFRLRFMKDDNDDMSADYLRFYSGNALTISYRPVLVVEYYLP